MARKSDLLVRECFHCKTIVGCIICGEIGNCDDCFEQESCVIIKNRSVKDITSTTCSHCKEVELQISKQRVSMGG